MLRSCQLLIVFLLTLFQLNLPAQDITGLWKGTLHSDTTGRDLRYEIAISEFKGKLSGFSHTFFIQDDKEYYGVKKVRVRMQDGKIIVEDRELIANNYPESPAKGIRQLNILSLEMRDSVMVLSGPFTTNRTRDYNSITGSIRVQRKADFHQSALVPHLQELGLAKELSFIEPDIKPVVRPTKVEEPVVKVTKPKKIKPVKEVEPVGTVTTTTVKNIEPTVIKPVQPAADVNRRIIETIQSVFFKSDSLVLTLYDNGEVDGDTVTVLMNGKVIMPMVGLSTRAVRKTIKITADMPDSIQLIMYAENLGSIPPNTGLLVVHDGEDIYEIRFSGDMEKNAAIVFRRKPAQAPPKKGFKRP